jgi:hypothetical protein
VCKTEWTLRRVSRETLWTISSRSNANARAGLGGAFQKHRRAVAREREETETTLRLSKTRRVRARVQARLRGRSRARTTTNASKRTKSCSRSRAEPAISRWFLPQSGCRLSVRGSRVCTIESVLRNASVPATETRLKTLDRPRSRIETSGNGETRDTIKTKRKSPHCASRSRSRSWTASCNPPSARHSPQAPRALAGNTHARALVRFDSTRDSRRRRVARIVCPCVSLSKETLSGGVE